MNSIEPMESESIRIELPLEAKFQLRKTEVAIKNLSRDELEQVHLRLVWQQIMERKALAAVLKENNIQISFDAPSDESMDDLEEICHGDNDEPFDFFY
jgi:hypothetical protein